MQNAYPALDEVAAPLDLSSVDTGQILPSRYLRKPRSAGLGDFLFRDARFDPHGAERPEFILNKEPYRNARILVAGSNFGCGSSREAAIHALIDSGFRCVIAPSFGSIFFSACFRNGLLPVVLPDAVVKQFRQFLHQKPGARIQVDLDRQSVELRGVGCFSFDIAAFRKERLMRGLDDCALALEKSAVIEKFARQYIARFPWANSKFR
jgi:3-isopropylmalate/(R)-2-methylmalate dehydratase small subunit